MSPDPVGANGLVRKTVRILRMVAAHPAGIGLSELSRTTQIPKATCLRVLHGLEQEQLVTLNAQTKRYRVALGALAIAGSLLEPAGAHHAVHGELERLAATTQETAGLDVLAGTDVMVIAQVAGPQLIGQTSKPVPRLLPTWCTSTGKLLLAHLPPDELTGAHGAALRAAGRRRSAPAFHRELDQIRREGYAVARDEMEAGAAAVAAPVSVDDAVAAAVWIGGPTFRLTEERVAELAAVVVACGVRLGELLSIAGTQRAAALLVPRPSISSDHADAL